MTKQGLSLRFSSVVVSMGLIAACAAEKPKENAGPAAESNAVENLTEALVTTTNATFQDGSQGYAGTRDTYLNQNSSGSSYGGATTLYVDGDDPAWTGRDLAVLLLFDISSIPSNAIVTAVALSVYVTDATVAGYPLYGMNRAWSENTATWTRAAFGSNWQISGARGALDRDSTLLGTLVATSTGSKTVVLNSSGLAKVQGWVANPASNFGLIIASPSITDKLAFHSSEYGTVALRPKLAVTYTVSTPDCIAPDCCTTDAACNDGNICTTDGCVSGVCAFTAVSGCCQSASDCADDGNACTSATCVGNVCGHAAIAGCCHADSDCADGDGCTTDTCVGNLCGHTAVAGCCNDGSDCDDGHACTSEACVDHACTSAPIAGCCDTNDECADTNPCTIDTCTDHLCTFAVIAGCCLTDGECSDGKVCTTDTCTGHQCVHSPIAGCCSADSECNDSNPCTTDACVASACAHTPIVGGSCGCNLDSDCDDDKDCTTDRCLAGACSNVEVTPGACGCQSNTACDDGDPCTIDLCAAGVCQNSAADCSDGDPQTTDQCVAGTCTHTGAGNTSTTRTFRNGENSYTGAADTKIAESYPATNYDTATVLVGDGDEPNGSGKDVSTLIRWDNLGIPSDAVVTAASITITIGGGSNSASATAYPLYAMTRPWTAGSATWETAEQGVPWATLGAMGATDREPASIGATPTNKSGSVTITLNASGVARVQSWVQNPSTNQGIIIASSSNTDGLSLYSSEYGTVAYRPMLSVTYVTKQTVSDPVPVGAPGNSPRYGFFVYSDSHVDAASNPVFSTALAQMNDLKHVAGAPPIIAAISLGDHTEDGGDASWDWHTNLTAPYWNAAATSFAGPAPRYLAVPGNHDVNDAANWYAFWSEHLPGQASLAGSSSSAGVYFATTYENALLVGLDTNKATNTSTSFSNDPQINLARTALATSTAPFKFMFYHKPAFYCGSGGEGANAASVAFVDLAAQHNVDAIFNGHSHVYSRTCRMTKNHACTGTSAGTVQVEVGTVGATDARLRSLKTTAQAVTGYDASGVSVTTSYTCSAVGGYPSTLGSLRTFCYVNVRGCWANLKCYQVGTATPFDTWTLNHCQ